MDKTEGQILQFPLEFPDTEPIGQRRVKFKGFTRHLHPQVTGVGSIKTQRLRPTGQTQHDDANILDHRQQHLAQHFNLRLDLDRVNFAGLEIGGHKTLGNRPQLVQPGNATDQMRRRLAEAFLDAGNAMFVLRRDGKQHRRDARLGVHFQAGNNHGHAQRVRPDAFATA